MVSSAAENPTNPQGQDFKTSQPLQDGKSTETNCNAMLARDEN